MNEFTKRQLDLFLAFINEYRNGGIDLNALVDRLESIVDFLEVDPLVYELDRLVGDVELINAVAIDKKQALSEGLKVELYTILSRMEEKVGAFCQSQERD